MPQYTEEFKQKVRNIYGNQFDKLLESGNPFLGRYLDDSCNGSIKVDTILLATNLEELQKLARKEKVKVELYNEYWNQPGVR
jgi:hypothetical protein